MEEVLSIKNLNKTFESGFKLKDINFDIKEEKLLALLENLEVEKQVYPK